MPPPPAGESPSASDGHPAGPPRQAPNRAVIIGLAVVAVLGAVFLLVNNLVAASAASQAEDALAESLEFNADVTVTRWPAGFRLLVGAPVDARIAGDDVPLVGTGAVLSSLELQMSDVTLPDNGQALHAEQAEFVAEFDEDGFADLLGFFGDVPLTDIELRDGTARLRVARFPVVDAEITARDGEIYVQPTAPLSTVIGEIPLPIGDLPLGFEVEEIYIDRGSLELHGSAQDFTLADQ